MASHNHHTIQHSIFSFAFILLQFSLLQFLSLGSYTLQLTYFINCGSDTNIKQNNNVYIAESDPDYPKKSFHKSYTESNPSSTSLPLYQSARIFQTQSSYEFNTIPNNTYMLRFHFFSFSSPTNLSTAKFNVSVSNFSPLLTFDAKNTTNSNSPLVKEYLVKITRSTFKITFTPQKSSFAFVNAIELFKLPLHLITDSATRFNYTESTGKPVTPYSGGYLSRALETKLRLNVGGETVTRDTDNLSREWLPDDSYITNPGNAKNFSFDGIIKFTAEDEYDGLNSDKYIGPKDVYGTAKENSNGSNGLNISWSVPVEKNIDHLLRVHFCDIFNPLSGLTDFLLFIYDSYVRNVNDDIEVFSPYYYDFVVRSDNSGLLKVTIQPNTTASQPNAFLNGLELMKVIESSGLVDLDDSDSNLEKVSLPVVVGSVIGGLVLLWS